MPMEYESLSELAKALGGMLAVKGRARKGLFNSEIKPIFDDIKTQNQFFLQQLANLRKDLAEIQKRARTPSQHTLDLIVEFSKVATKLSISLQNGRADRRRIYEESRAMKMFPYFQEHFLHVLNKSQRIMIVDFYDSIHLYFDHQGAYGHELRHICGTMDAHAEDFLHRKYIPITVFEETLCNLANSLQTHEQLLLDRWALIVRKYTQLRSEFRYKS